MKYFSDQKIIDSWAKNVAPWIAAVQKGQIESRRLMTDQAIIEAVMALNGSTVIDIGCGEGWLSRALSDLGLSVFGVDAIAALITEAKQKSNSQFEVLAYENITTETISQRFDIAVCNFSLLGKESVDSLFKVLPTLLNKDGYFVVQTPHPKASSNALEYVDGWRQGSWKGFDSAFTDPAPWYFRTLETWKQLFLDNEFQIRQISETVSVNTKEVSSIIIVGQI